jgi:hypothetical protein
MEIVIAALVLLEQGADVEGGRFAGRPFSLWLHIDSTEFAEGC